MKREHWIVTLLVVAAVLYFGWPHFRAGWAHVYALVNPNSASPVVDGTAHSGADATVLTSACQ